MWHNVQCSVLDRSEINHMPHNTLPLPVGLLYETYQTSNGSLRCSISEFQDIYTSRPSQKNKLLRQQNVWLIQKFLTVLRCGKMLFFYIPTSNIFQPKTNVFCSRKFKRRFKKKNYFNQSMDPPTHVVLS